MESSRTRWFRAGAAAFAVLAALTVAFALGEASSPAASGEPSQQPGGPATGTIVTEPAAGCEEAAEPMRIVQERSDGPPGIVAAWFEEEQALAQTFTAPASGLHLVEVALVFEYALGEGGTLSVHAVEDPRDPTSGEEVAVSEMDALSLPSGEPARIRFDPPVPLACGDVYSIVIRPATDSELSILSTSPGMTGNVYPGGAMFIGGPGRWEATGGEMRFAVLMEP